MADYAIKGGETVLYFADHKKGDMVKVAQTPERPRYYCEKCDKNFPSALDIEEHVKVDHATSVSTA